MKHFIMGTAGHIDHGKTTLIQKLTGYDCDTHKEEKSRGITIHLGFTHFATANNEKVGIIDVPGHSDFVNTMVSGASGIDFVLLVIAADAGIMPQTEEHFSIMKILGIKTGIIVLTKTDLVESEYIDLIEEEVKDFTTGSFLTGSPIIRYSAVSNTGLEDVKDAINNIIADLKPIEANQIFRLYIDRLFSLPGFGMIAAGTVRSGRFSKNGQLYLFPHAKKVRVRKMERYGEEVDELVAGDRGSLNITGVDKEGITKGMLLTDGLVQGTKMIDAKLTLFSSKSQLNVWSQCLFLHGSEHYKSKIHLLDKDSLNNGESALVQIHLDKYLYGCYGDRFVIRNSSSDMTLGGGEIIDVRPLHHKRRTQKVVSEVKKIATGSIEELIAAEVRKSVNVVTLYELIPLFNIIEQEALRIISDELPQDILALSYKDCIYLTEKIRFDKLSLKIQRHLKTYHKNNPLEEQGRSFDELMGLFGKERNDKLEAYMRAVLDILTKENVLKKVKDTWIIATHNVILSDKLKSDISFIENYLKSCQLQVPLMSEMLPAAEQRAIDKSLLLQILKLLVNRNKAYRIENNYVHSSIVDEVRWKLLQELTKKKDGLTIADFRDLIDGNRKMCLLLIGLYDSEGVTVRKGDYRVITEKGKEVFKLKMSRR